MGREVEYKLKSIILEARTSVQKVNGYNVGLGHIIVSVISDGNNRAMDVLDHMKVDTEALYDRFYREVYTEDLTPRPYQIKEVKIGYTEEMKLVFKLLEQEAINLGEIGIDTSHMFLAILKRDNDTRRLLNQFGITYNEFREAIISMNNFEEHDEDDYENSSRNRPKRPTGRIVMGKNEKLTPTLDQYCRDVSEAVREGKVDPVVGREKEIKRISMILSRRKKNNPVLIGEPGVGKCICIDTQVVMRDDITGEVFEITISELLNTITDPE